MEKVFEAINGVFSFIGPLSDFLWEFPTNFDWYSSIPILGNISFAIILLLGSGIFFSFRIGFMQVTYFKKGIRTMTEKRVVETGISPLASFFLSSAMRVGPGNILGVTGAIAVGGPGALFWMWISAFFGMAVAYMEGVLAQIFKEKKDDEFVGGLPFYGRKLLGNKVWIGVFLSVLYILYALCCLPAQGFNVVSSVGRMAEIVTGKTIPSGSAFYYIVGTLIVILTAAIAFGGIKKVSRWTDMMVPVMAVITHIKIRKSFPKLVAQLSGGKPSLFVRKFLDDGINGLAHPLEIFVLPGAGAALFAAVSGFFSFCCSSQIFLLLLLLLVAVKKIQIFKLVACGNKRLRRLLLSHTQDQHSGFPEPCCQTGEIAVRRNNTISIHISGIQNIHGINDHRRIGCVFSGGIAVLLDRNDGILQKNLFPGGKPCTGPVSIDPFVGGYADVCHFIHDDLDVFV